ncbi:MAG: hypothetical protein CME20_05905 [Gemmatimonadetes bacterium]|nr:hypothetical protein [Gemmatimonadota bacterium]
MKFITAIAALALLAGSIDVEAQQRKNLNKKSGRSEKPEAHQIAREVAEDGQQQQIPVAHLAIRAFSELDKEDVQDLVEAAEEGDREALAELRADRVEAVEAMIETLQDEDARALIKLGMMLGVSMWEKPDKDKPEGGMGGILDHVDMDDTVLEDLTAPSLVDLDEKLDMAEEQLEAQLNNFLSNQEVNSLPTEDREKPY